MRFLSFFMRKQIEATNYIKSLLASRNLKIESGIVMIAEEGWQVFDYNSKCIGIDPNSGVWIGPSGGDWESLGVCTVSSTLQAVEFLTKE